MNGFWNSLAWLNENIALVGIESAVQAGYAGAVLAVIVLAVNLLFRRWLTASQMLLLWGLVLLRMAIPIAPSSQASIHNAVVWLISEPQAADAGAVVEDVQLASAQEPLAAILPSADASNVEFQALVVAETSAMIDWIPLIWLAGALFVFVWTLWTHWRFTRRIARVDVCNDERVLRPWRHCRGELGVRSKIPVVVCDEVGQPAIAGVWRVKLLLPPHCLDLGDEPLRLVMLHELMHVRCWDVAVNWLLALVRAAQWWNPFFWLAAFRFVGLREQSRDAMVLRHLGAGMEQSRSYAELLLSLAGQGDRRGWRVLLPASLLGFISGWFRKRGVANRLKAMTVATRRQRRWHRAVVFGAMLAVGLMGLTDAKEPKTNSEPVYSDVWQRVTSGTGDSVAIWPADSTSLGPNFNEESGSWSEQEYDVTRGAAIIMRQESCEAEQLAQLLQWDLISLADPQRASVQPPNQEVAALARAWTDRRESADKNSPPTLSKRPRAELRRDGERWLIHAAGPQSMHHRIEQQVHAWNRSGWGQVALETRIATTKKNVLDAIDLDSVRFKAAKVGTSAATPSDAEAAAALRVDKDATAIAVSAVEHHIPVLLATLTDDQTRQFVRTAQGDNESSIMFAPKVTLLNGQQGRVFSGVHRPFVVGLKEGSDGGLEPQIRVVPEGFDLYLHPELTEEHMGIDLAARLELSDTKDVQEFSTRVQGKQLTVQVPSVSHTRVRTTANLKDNQTLLLCIPPTYDQKHYAWVLLTARIVAEERVGTLGTIPANR